MAQKGFTMLELLVAVAVGAIISTAAVLTIHQLFVNTQRNNLHIIALSEIHRAALQIKKDLQSHTTANVSDLQFGATTFWWTDQSGHTSLNASQHYTIYSLSGKELRRNYDGFTTILGRNIESVIFSNNGTHINAVITANNSTLPGRSETLSFGIRRRSDERFD